MNQRIPAIIVVNFNSGPLLERCIDSIAKLALSPRTVVVDNGSTDGSADFLKPLASPHLSLISAGRNLGFAGGNNLAVPAAGSDSILFLNPDCQIDDRAFNSLISALDASPTIGMVGPLILNEDGTEQRGCRRSEPTPILVIKTLFSKRNGGVNRVGTQLPDEPTEIDAISGACMLVKREALQDVGLLDEGYFLHFEDLDWCKRFRERGWKVLFVPHSVITHYKGGSSRSIPVRVEWHKHKGMVRYYKKFFSGHYPAPFLWAVYAAVWVRFFLMAPVWWIKGFRA